jgi:hypothetical protein
MKKFSKLLAVVLTIAVVICPMTSAIVANATSGGSYSIVAENANDVVLTISSNDGFLVYQATVTFNDGSAFQDSYSSGGYTNGLKVIDYTVVSPATKDAYNAPAISAQKNGSSLVILVSATDAATLDLYSEIQIGIRVASGSTASLSKIQAADQGTVEEDPTLLNFGAKVAADGTVDTTNNENATTGVSHEHNFTKTTPYEVTAPTCTTYGVYRKTCETCGAVDSSATYTGNTMANHTPSGVQNATSDFLKTAANCTEPAVYYYECTVCHAAITEEMAGYTGTFTNGAALGHTMTAYAASPADCTTPGNSAYWECTTCHKYFSDAAGNTEIANNSWVIPATGHTETTIPAVAATCTTAGSTAGVKCSVCDAVITAPTPIAALGHNMTAHAATAATCTAAGNSAYWSCDRCSKYFSDAEGNTEIAANSWVIAATGHTPVTDEAVAPTCTETGLTQGSHCSVCSAVIVAQETVPATGHTSVTDEAVAPTCTETGLTAGAHCSVCSAVLTAQEVVPATGHTSVTDEAVAPTCTETGLTAGAHCSVCSAVLTAQEVVPATGHTSVTDAAVAPTCTETGLTAGAHCSVCSTVLTAQTVVPALGHDYTYTSNDDGTHDVGCTRCDFADTEECDTAGAMGACSKCGYAVSSGEPVHDTSIRINDVVATIGSAIDLRYRVTKSTVSSYDHYDLVITPKKYDKTAANLYNVIDGAPVVLTLDRSTASYDIFYYRNTFIHELGLRITAKVNCYDSSDNLVAYSDETTIVPAQMLTDTYNSSSDSVKTVVVDLLNMCAAVQTQFAANAPTSDLATTVNSGNLANKGVSQTYATASYGSLNTTNTTTWNPSTNLDQTNNRLATNIVVGKAPNIQYVVYKGTSLDREDLELNISYTSNNSTVGDAGAISYTISGSDWGTSGTKLTYNIEDLAYYDGNVTVTATLTYKGVLAWTNQFSVESGINANLTNPGSSAALLDTMNALAIFGKSARVYTGRDS